MTGDPGEFDVPPRPLPLSDPSVRRQLAEAEAIDREAGRDDYNRPPAASYRGQPRTDPDVGSALRVRQADLSRSTPPRWAWAWRLLIGYLNLLIGNEGVGKGALACWLLAGLTLGLLPGDLYGQPVNVGVIGDEDDFDRDWTPRLHAAGADLQRVVQIDRPDGGYVNITEDRDRLAAVVTDRRLGMLFFDQLLDNLGASVDDWRQKQVREALQPIRTLSRELDVATLLTLHPNKRGETFRQLVSGAAAFNALSRSSLLLAEHPDNEDVRVLARGKGNLSERPPASEFRIRAFRFSANGHKFNVPVVCEFTDSTLTVNDLLGNDQVREEHTRIGECAELLAALLPADGRWRPSKPITEACAADGFDDRMVRRAKNRLRIEHRFAPEFRKVSEWRRLPVADTLRTSAEPVRNGAPTTPNPLRGGVAAIADTTDNANTGPQRGPQREPDPIMRLPGETYEQWEQRIEALFGEAPTS